jgi:mRNA interferase MazF
MEVVSFPRRDEVWLIGLDRSRGSETKKTRPCLVVSPDEMNEPLETVLVAPMTTTLRSYPTRVTVTFRGKKGQVALDQIRAVDRSRLVKRLGAISGNAAQETSTVLLEMFAR